MPKLPKLFEDTPDFYKTMDTKFHRVWQFEAAGAVIAVGIGAKIAVEGTKLAVRAVHEYKQKRVERLTLEAAQLATVVSDLDLILPPQTPCTEQPIIYSTGGNA